jgi:hypothetical protein
MRQFSLSGVVHTLAVLFVAISRSPLAVTTALIFHREFQPFALNLNYSLRASLTTAIFPKNLVTIAVTIQVISATSTIFRSHIRNAPKAAQLVVDDDWVCRIFFEHF